MSSFKIREENKEVGFSSGSASCDGRGENTSFLNNGDFFVPCEEYTVLPIP